MYGGLTPTPIKLRTMIRGYLISITITLRHGSGGEGRVKLSVIGDARSGSYFVSPSPSSVVGQANNYKVNIYSSRIP